MSNIILKEAIKFSLRFGSGFLSGVLIDSILGGFFPYKLDLILSLISLSWTAYSTVNDDFENIPPSLGFLVGSTSFSLYKYIQSKYKKDPKLVADVSNLKKNSKNIQY